MIEDKNIYEEITLNGKKEKIITKLDENEIETNDTKLFLDNTLPLDEIIKEIEENE